MGRDSNFDLIITDLNMPGKNGVELSKAIRKNWSSSLPIVLATTESEQSQKDHAKAAGVNAFLTKPVSRELLEETVHNFCCPEG